MADPHLRLAKLFLVHGLPWPCTCVGLVEDRIQRKGPSADLRVRDRVHRARWRIGERRPRGRRKTKPQSAHLSRCQAVAQPADADWDLHWAILYQYADNIFPHVVSFVSGA